VQFGLHAREHGARHRVVEERQEENGEQCAESEMGAQSTHYRLAELEAFERHLRRAAGLVGHSSLFHLLSDHSLIASPKGEHVPMLANPEPFCVNGRASSGASQLARQCFFGGRKVILAEAVS
jgi:hypothetical protein